MQEQYRDAIPVLKLSADLIDTEGWIRGSMYRPDRGYCSIGAIGFVASGRVPRTIGEGGPTAVLAVHALRTFLAESITDDEDPWNYGDVGDEWDTAVHPFETVIDWNDSDLNDKAVVVGAMRAAVRWIETADA